MPNIPLYIIHGQLGAGKTTVLTGLLQRPEFANVRIVENEFAAHGIDGGRLHDDHPHLNIYEISGTCVCCTGSESLMRTLLTLAGSSHEAMPVIVETTGAADAARLLRTLLLDPEFHEHFSLAANILVIDALTLYHQPNKLHNYRSDILLADVVVLTKTDLLTEVDVQSIETRIAQMAGDKRVMLADRGTLSEDLHLAQVRSQASDALLALSDMDSGKDHEDMMWRAVAVPQTNPSEFVESLNVLKAQGAQVLRIKGIVRDRQGQAWRIDGTEHASEFHKVDNTEVDPVVVLIGKNLPNEIPV